MKLRKTQMRFLKIGDKFKFINAMYDITYTLTEKISGYVGESTFPWIILDTQDANSPFISCFRITAEWKKGKAPHRHSYTEDYSILKVIKGIPT